MKGLVAYHNEEDEWRLWALHGTFNNIVKPVSFFNFNKEGRELYPKIIEVEIEEVKQAEAGYFTWKPKNKLPEMPDLHARIKANILVLKSHMTKAS